MVSAYNTSGLLQQNRAVLRAADEDVATAASQLAPVISWHLRFHIAVVTSVLMIRQECFSSADFTVYDGGKRNLGLEAAKFSVLATRSKLVGIEQNVLLRLLQLI